MKLVIKREDLLNPLQKVTGIIDKKHTIRILLNVLLKSEQDGITLIGTNADIQIVAKAFLTVDEPGEVTVSARKLQDICKFLPESSEMKLKERQEKLEIKCGNSDFVLRTLPSENFPTLKETISDHEILIDSKGLKSAIDNTAFCMGYEDVRKFLNGLYFCAENQALIVIASDGHRLAKTEAPLKESITEKLESIVPRKAVLELQRLLEDTGDTVRLQFSNKYICAHLENLVFTAKLVDCKFPNYKNTIPSLSENVIKIDTKQFKEALTRVAILSNEVNHGVLFTINPNELILNSYNNDQEQGLETVPLEYQGEPIVTGFNSSYILDALNKITSAYVSMSIQDDKGTLIMTSVEENNSKFIIMPVRL